jgi:hypothetical protein
MLIQLNETMVNFTAPNARQFHQHSLWQTKKNGGYISTKHAGFATKNVP